MPENDVSSPFQFTMAHLLAAVTVFALFFSSEPTRGPTALFVGIPLVLAAVTALSGAGTRGLRKLCLVLAACGTLFFLLVARLSYPIIVLDDGYGPDLGPMILRADDWMSLCRGCFAVLSLIVIGNCTKKTGIRLVLTLPLPFYILAQEYESPDTPIAARMGVASLAAIVLGADGLPALARGFPSSPLVTCVWVLAVPGLALLSDWVARVSPSPLLHLPLLILDAAVVVWISLHDQPSRSCSPHGAPT